MIYRAGTAIGALPSFLRRDGADDHHGIMPDLARCGVTGPPEVTVGVGPGCLSLPGGTRGAGLAGHGRGRGVVWLLPGGSGGELALDAAQQLMVGVAERADAVALEPGRDGGQVEPGGCGAGQHLFGG